MGLSDETVPAPRLAGAWRAIGWGILALLAGVYASSAFATKTERDPITFKIAAVNPSAEKRQSVPVRIELPQEVKPEDILDKGELDMEFDEEHSMYYVFKKDVQLAPKETKVFEVVVRDVWFVRDEQLNSLKEYTGVVLKRLESSEYYKSAKQLADSIVQRLDDIAAVQNDETLSRKSRIGAYRINLQTIEKVKEDLARMEKLLAFTGGPPVPAMLEESPLKSDAPSTTTTWLVIFLIVIFIGLLGGQFFLTWHRRAQTPQELAIVKQGTFPSIRQPAGAGSKPAPAANGQPAPSRQPVGAPRNGPS
ncbi:MAG: hypothetical protein HYZ92_04735 [Candidatus Omnitrophica bacterium]|nr:hypothetical protein [Candidatus Omnitrophota bacterium]